MNFIEIIKNISFIKFVKGRWPFLALVVTLTAGFIYAVFDAKIFVPLNQLQSFITVIVIVMLAFVVILYSLFIAGQDEKYKKDKNPENGNNNIKEKMEKKLRDAFSPSSNHRLEIFASKLSKRKNSIDAGFDYNTFVNKNYEQRIAYLITLFDNEKYKSFLAKEINAFINDD